MKNFDVRTYPSREDLPRHEQLAWRIAEVAADPVPVDDDVTEMIGNRLIDNAAVAAASLRGGPSLAPQRVWLVDSPAGVKWRREARGVRDGLGSTGRSDRRTDVAPCAQSQYTRLHRLPLHHHSLKGTHMDPSDIVATIERIATAHIDATDRDDLAGVVRDVARVRAWLDAVDVRCTRRGRALAAAGRAEAAETLHSRNGGRSNRDSTAITDREAVSEQMPSFEDSLADGEVSAGHLDAIANALRHATPEVRAAFADYEAGLLRHAVTDTVDVFARRCRELVRHLGAQHNNSDPEVDELERQKAASSVRRWIDNIDGMHHTHIALDPERDAQLNTAINRTLARMCKVRGNRTTSWQQMQLNALVATVVAGAPDEVSGEADDVATVATIGDDAEGVDDPRAVAAMIRHQQSRQPEIGVFVDYRTLCDGLHAESICETVDGIALPVDTIRRLCCDAEIIPYVLGGDRETLDVGRSRRTVTPAQRRTLASMQRTCGFYDCDVPFSHTKAHHIDWWYRDQGPTDIDNLLGLCDGHHHLVHDDGWILTMTPDRIATWTRPDGTIAHHGTTIDRRPLAPPARE